MDYDLNDLASDAGTEVANVAKNIVGAVADAACSVYRSDPGGVIGVISASNPVSAFVDGAWRSLCGPRGGNPDPPPPPPFTGGQCSTVYYVIYKYGWTDSVTGPFVTANNTVRRFYGPIGGVAWVAGGGFTTIKITSRGELFAPGTPYAAPYQGEYESVQDGLGRSNFVIVGLNIYREDGLPDSCGSLDSQYPNASGPPIGASTVNVDVPVAGTTVSVPVNINFPGAGGLEFGITNVLNAKLNLGGIVIDLSGNGLDGAADLTALENSVKKLLNADEKNTDPPIPKDEDDKDDDDDDEPGIRAIQVTITDVPSNADTEVSPGFNRFDDLGFVSFKIDGYCLPPERIQFNESYFLAPLGCNGYRVKFNVGVEGSYEVIKEQPEE